MIVFLVVFEAARLALRAMLLVLSYHFLRAAWSSARDADPILPEDPDPWPSVTVQLPLRNEFYVAERAIRCAVALDYPPACLYVQVLDDSDDETTAKVREIVNGLAAEGVNIELLHRERPTAFKAGALNAGLAVCETELVAIFDADCVPAPDFLKRTVAHFQKPHIGCVQVRWSFLNRSKSILTRL